MLMQIIFGSGLVNLLIWVMLFMTSTAAVALIIKLCLELRRGNFSNAELERQVAGACQRDDLNAAYAACQEAESTLYGATLNAVFARFHLGPQERETAAEEVIAARGRTLQRLINLLSLCGNIAPMLGLLGTVTGMVSAFMGLGTAMGPEKASVLAISISQALYTTAAGLLIAVPAITAVVLLRNRMEERMEAVVAQTDALLKSFAE